MSTALYANMGSYTPPQHCACRREVDEIHLWKTQAVVTASLMLAALAGCATSNPTATPQHNSAPASAPQHTLAPAAAPRPNSTTTGKLTLQLSWLPSPPNAAFWLAKSKGYYRAAGLNVTIVPGRSQQLMAQRVAANPNVIGEGTAASVFPAISKGLPIRVVAAYLRESSLAIVYHTSLAIRTPKDLLGKKIVTSVGEAPWTLLPAVLARYGVSPKQLHVSFVAPNQLYSQFVRHTNVVEPGQMDGLIDAKLALNVPDLRYHLFSDFGVTLYDLGVVANTALIAQHPRVVKAFVAASTRGWEQELHHPSQAVDAVVAEAPSIDRKAVALGIHTDLKLLYSKRTRGAPLGQMNPNEIAAQLKLLHQAVGMRIRSATDYYTNRFVGTSSD